MDFFPDLTVMNALVLMYHGTAGPSGKLTCRKSDVDKSRIRMCLMAT